jgi:hypothetical protein
MVAEDHEDVGHELWHVVWVRVHKGTETDDARVALAESRVVHGLGRGDLFDRKAAVTRRLLLALLQLDAGVLFKRILKKYFVNVAALLICTPFLTISSCLFSLPTNWQCSSPPSIPPALTLTSTRSAPRPPSTTTDMTRETHSGRERMLGMLKNAQT